MLVELALLVVLVLLLRSWWLGNTAGKNMPPGPTIYPVLGSKFVQTAEEARQMKRNYGNVVRTKMGVCETFILNDYKLIKEAFLKFEFADRPDWKTLHFLTYGKPAGVIMTNGQQWLNARRFLLRNLRDLGMGKSQMDQVIQQEAQMLVNDFKNYDGKLTNAPESINITVLNVIWQLVANRRYELNDPKIFKFIRLIKAIQDDSTSFLLPDIFPIVNYLPGFIKRKVTAKDLVDEVVKQGRGLILDMIDEHKKELDRNHPRDVIDEYLLEMEKDSEMADYFSHDDLMRIIFDLFVAGFDTTSSTLRWLILYMAAYPEVQEKVQQEIDSKVPRDTLPSHLQKSQLPYLDATLHEVLRKSSLVPFAVAHTSNQDAELGGYFFPKGTSVLGASVLVHEDPHYWPQPHVFNPERFIDKDGKFLSQKEGFIPFGIGKRQCLGEALARMELFIFSAALLQNFTFAPSPGVEVDLEPTGGFFGQFARAQDISISARK